MSAAEILKAALATERTTAERLTSLHELHEFLRDEEILQQLAKAAPAEESLDVRTAMLRALVDGDVTRLKDRAPFMEALSYFASMEPEAPLRLIALAWLGELAPSDPAVQTIFIETLLHDFDDGVRLQCIAGLKAVTRKERSTIDALAKVEATPTMRPALLELVGQLESADQQRLMAGMLHPWEPPAVRAQILDRLGAMPSLSAEAGKILLDYIRQEQDRALRSKAVLTLAAASQADPALFAAALELLEQAPDHAELMTAFKNRLASFPDLVGKLAALFGKTGAMFLKIAILDLLGTEGGPGLALAAMQDKNPWVRYRGISLAGALMAQHPGEIQRALASAIPTESITSLREQMVRQFLAGGRKEKEVERFLVEQAERETEPSIEEALASAVMDIPIDDSNRAALLRVYRKVITEPFFDERVKSAAMGRLRAFAYRDEPELVECFKAILERTPDIETVDNLHELLRKLEPDIDGLAPMFLKLFYRFLDHYPRDPLHGWLKDFRQVAANSESIRAQIPYIVKLTGATWILDAADAAGQKSTFLPAMKEALSGKGGFRGADNLLSEAWEKRALKKSDLLWLFKRLLYTPQQDGMKQQVIKIMAEGKLVSPEIVDACLGFLARRNEYEVKKFLEENGQVEPTYLERVFKRFTQEAYTDWCRRSQGADDVKEIPRNWNNWEYQGWRLMHREWPIGELFFALSPWTQVEAILSTPPDPSIAPTKTLHYYVLETLWRLSGKDWTAFNALKPDDFTHFLVGAGRLMRASKGHLRDRAVAIYKHYWRFYNEKKGPITPELADFAAEASIELLKLNDQYGGKADAKEAEPLKGSDGATMERLWPYEKAKWPEFYESKVKTATEEEETKAKELWGLAYRGDAGAIRELAGPLKHTTTGRQRAKQIVQMLAKLT